jgi:hypothetical protein
MQVWCRVRSLHNGHDFDVPIERLDLLLNRGAVEEIPGRRHTGAAKPPKSPAAIRATVPRPTEETNE